MTQKVYPNVSQDEAAKTVSKEGLWFVIPENGEGKQKEKKVFYVQKHSEPGLLAEAVIVDDTPYFAVSKIVSGKVRVTLEESIPKGDKTEYRPFELSAYLNQPYTFSSKKDFE